MTFSHHVPDVVCYRNRLTQTIEFEAISHKTFLRWVYGSFWGFFLFSLFLNNTLFSWIYGYFQRLPTTRHKISTFVKEYSINTEDIELSLDQYPNFNAFFTRRLKPDSRSFSPNPDIFCSPADGKVLVIPHLSEVTCIQIKGIAMNMEELLASKKEAKRYDGGSAMIIRLAPYDYHRFHFPDTGIASDAQYISGQYHSVNAIAQSKVPTLFSLNKRAVTHFDSQNFGHIAYVEIGAITIGSIVQTSRSGTVRKGQEKGYFQYGGSTIVLVFEANNVVFDDDLLRDSEQGLEVQILTGEQLGRKR